MTLSPIVRPVEYRCPHCSTPVGLVTPDGTTSAGERIWLQDGDTVPGIVDLFDKVEGRSFAAALMVGHCPACPLGHYVLEATFVDGGEDALLDWWAGGFEIEATTHRAGTLEHLPDATWAVAHATTSCGKRVDEHLIGPFPLDVASVTGPAGVSACCGRSAAPAWQLAAQQVRMAWMDLVAASAPEPEPVAG